jgi:hypothetical protein
VREGGRENGREGDRERRRAWVSETGRVGGLGWRVGELECERGERERGRG